MGVENREEKDTLETLLDEYLSYYEGYLDHLVNDYGVKLSDKVRLKNINEFKIRFKSSFTPEFRIGLAKTYNLVATVWPSLDKPVIELIKKEIESGEISIITNFKKREKESEEVEINLVFFLKKRDTLGNFKQRIKGLLDHILPGEKPQVYPS